MNILRMKYFIDVANFGSFTKAAQHNYVSQTAVSQQIALIERELEAELFIRSKGQNKLTPAGEVFLQHCVRIVAEYERALEMTARAQRDQGAVIRLGILTTCRMGYLYDIIRNFQKDYPKTDIKLVHCTFATLRKQLESRELDAGIAATTNLQGIENVKVERMTRFKMGLLVSRENPLAQYDEIPAKIVAGEKIVVTSRRFMGDVYDYMLEQRRLDGFLPNIVETADSVEILVMLVEMNRGVAYLPERTAKYNKKLCKMLHIYDNSDYLEYSLAWQNDESNKALLAFVACAREFFHKELDAWLDANELN